MNFWWKTEQESLIFTQNKRRALLMSTLTPFFPWFQMPSIILNAHSTGLPWVNAEQIPHADMFWTNTSWLFKKKTKLFKKFLFIKWKIRTLRCPERRWWETEKPCGKTDICPIKTRIYTLFGSSNKWCTGKNFCILMNLKYWQTVFSILWLKTYTLSFIVSKDVKTFCLFLFRFESRQIMCILVYNRW